MKRCALRQLLFLNSWLIPSLTARNTGQDDGGQPSLKFSKSPGLATPRPFHLEL